MTKNRRIELDASLDIRKYRNSGTVTAETPERKTNSNSRKKASSLVELPFKCTDSFVVVGECTSHIFRAI